MSPLDVPGLLAAVDDTRPVADGGDHPTVANTITAEDLVAVTLPSVDVPAVVALQLLEGQLGGRVGQLLASKVRARKHPHLVTVYDSVVRCSLGNPTAPWAWLRTALTAQNTVLVDHLRAAQETAALPASVSILRGSHHARDHRP